VGKDGPGGPPNATRRKFGHSKEGFWAPQVVVALAVTRESVSVRSWILPGNTADVSTVEMVRSDLRGWNLGLAMFVADSGMNSADNRCELAKACSTYLLGCRMANMAEIKRDVLSKQGDPGCYQQDTQIVENISPQAGRGAGRTPLKSVDTR
jgi:transposase